MLFLGGGGNGEWTPGIPIPGYVPGDTGGVKRMDIITHLESVCPMNKRFSHTNIVKIQSCNVTR